MSDLAAEQPGDHAPDRRDPRDLERGARMPVEDELRLPRGRSEAAEGAGELVLVAGCLVGDDRLRREPRRQERLGDPVARERVDETGGVADEQDGPLGGAGRTSYRQDTALQIGQALVVHAVLGTESAEVLAQPRSLGSPTADAVVRVVCFREDPAVPAGDDAELDRRDTFLSSRQRTVPLERDPVDDPAAEPAVARDPPVDPVGADEEATAYGRAADTESGSVRSDSYIFDRDTVAEDRSRLRRLLDQEGVEPPPLGHQDERRLAAALEALPVGQAHFEAPHDVLDDRRDVDRELLDCATGDPAAAGLVPREAGTVGEEDGGARASKVDRRRRSRRPGPDDDRVEPLHGLRLQWPALQGCPSGQRERAVNPPAQPTKVRILPPASHQGASRIGICWTRFRSAQGPKRVASLPALPVSGPRPCRGSRGRSGGSARSPPARVCASSPRRPPRARAGCPA